MTPEVSATVVGAGGNIGGQLVRLLARIRELSRVRLVDPDFYEARNRAGQEMLPDDVGKRKVVVQGRWLKRANPATLADHSGADSDTTNMKLATQENFL